MTKITPIPYSVTIVSGKVECLHCANGKTIYDGAIPFDGTCKSFFMKGDLSYRNTINCHCYEPSDEERER